MITHDEPESQAALVDPKATDRSWMQEGYWDYLVPDHKKDCWLRGCKGTGSLECTKHRLSCPCLECKAKRQAGDRPKRARSIEEERTELKQLELETEALELDVRRRKALYEAHRFDRLEASGSATPDIEALPAQETLADFTKSFADLDGFKKVPALLERSDGATLLYCGKLNSIYGLPGSGKSWLAVMCSFEAITRGGHCFYWDHEDSIQTLNNRAGLIGFDPLTHADAFQYLMAGVQESPSAMSEALEWLATAPDPTYNLVVIDAAESSGCPSDGGNVVPWLKSHVNPWLNVGSAVLLIDHIPKSKIDRPRGAIGSQHKRAMVRGAGLAVSGVPWSQHTPGTIKLRNDKDNQGDLPAPDGKVAALVKAGYDEAGNFSYAIVPPDGEESVDVTFDLLDKIAQHSEGVSSARAIRKLVKGKGSDIDAALDNLISDGMVEVGKVGRANVYTITPAGLETLANE